MNDAWIKLNGTILRGHQVASRPSKHYPESTLKLQMPHFKARGLDLSAFYLGTLNISIHPLVFTMLKPQYTFHNIKWTDQHPPEHFSFSACRVIYKGNTYQGWVYYPHPETKERNFQDPAVVEVIAPPIQGLAYGEAVQIELNPAEIVVYDNQAEYKNAGRYDLENDKSEPETSFYLALARRFGEPVLELGCGTGRFTIPLAQQGVKITGLDLSPEMLARARQKAGSQQIEWVQADIRRFSLGRQFSFIFESGATFQHLLERIEHEAFLGCVRQHLAQAGVFVIAARLPTADTIKSNMRDNPWYTYGDDHGYQISVSGTEYYDPIRQIKTETAIRRWTDSQGKECVERAPLRLRYFFPQELEALLHYNGFKVVERYGGPDFSPLTADSEYIVYVARSRQSGS